LLKIDLADPARAENSLMAAFEEASPLSQVEGLELASRVGNSRRWMDTFDGVLCLIPTRPFLELLAKLVQEGRHRVVVEVGAGYGLIRLAFQQTTLLEGVSYHATDVLPRNQVVESFSHEEAVEKYRPSLVISSWPPPRIALSWPQEWEELGVREYLAIVPRGSYGEYSLWAKELADPLPGWERVNFKEMTKVTVDTYGCLSRCYLFRKEVS